MLRHCKERKSQLHQNTFSYVCIYVCMYECTKILSHQAMCTWLWLLDLDWLDFTCILLTWHLSCLTLLSIEVKLYVFLILLYFTWIHCEVVVPHSIFAQLEMKWIVHCTCWKRSLLTHPSSQIDLVQFILSFFNHASPTYSTTNLSFIVCVFPIDMMVTLLLVSKLPIYAPRSILPWLCCLLMICLYVFGLNVNHYMTKHLIGMWLFLLPLAITYWHVCHSYCLYPSVLVCYAHPLLDSFLFL